MKLWFWISGWFLCILAMVVNGQIAVVKYFKILDFYEAPPNHSNGFYILGNSFSFHSYSFFIFDYTHFIRTCDDHRRLIAFPFRDNLVRNANLFSYIHVSGLIYDLNSRDRTEARQLNFNHRVVKVQTRNNSAVKWVVLVTCVFLLCYAIFLRCS